MSDSASEIPSPGLSVSFAGFCSTVPLFLNIFLGWFICIHFVKLWLRWSARDEVVVEHEVCKRVCERGRGREGWRGRVCERVDLKDCIYARREH